MNFIPLGLLMLTLLFIGASRWCFHHQIRRQRMRSQPSPGRRSRRVHYSAVPLVLLVVLAVFFMATLIAYCTHIQIVGGGDTAASEPPAPDPDPDPEESQAADLLPTSRPLKSVLELFPDFHLSAMVDSELLGLVDQMIQGEPLTFDLISDAENRFTTYLAGYAHPPSFCQYYKGLEDYFPAGDEVIYTFDNVVNREQCDAQLRGAGERLDQAKNGSSMDKEEIVKSSHQMAVRALDAMGFTKYPEMQAEVEAEPETESQQKWHIWLYAEIFLPSQINSYSYSLPDNIASYKWHYSFSQTFDYLGGIADSKEWKLKMYFASAVFLHRTYELMKEQGFQDSLEDNDYKKNDHKIWELYVEMLYRVAARGEPSAREDFFKEIQRVEDTILNQPFSQEILDSMSATLDNLELYIDWKDMNE